MSARGLAPLLLFLGCTSPAVSSDAPPVLVPDETVDEAEAEAEAEDEVPAPAPDPPETRTQRQGLTADPQEPTEKGKRHLFDRPDPTERTTPRRTWRKNAKKRDAGVGVVIGRSVAGLAASGSTVYPVLDDSRLPGLQPGPYKLEQWVDRSVDCGIHRFGAKNNNVCDYAPAFERIFLDVATNLGAVDFDWLGYGDHTGTKILVPAGLLWLSRTVRICRAMVIDGVSGGIGGASNFYTPHGTGAFRVAYYDECVDLGEGEGGSDSILSNFNVFEATGLPVNSALVVGIQLDTMAALKDMWIYGFVQGVRVSADVNRVPRTNANGWRIDHVRVTNPEHAGIFVDGGDANIGLGLQPNVVSACGRGSYWQPTLGPCANQIYSDFLGSTIIASHASGSYDTTSGANFNNYLSEGSSQRMTIVGGYSESDDMRPVLSEQTIWLGNTAKDAQGGLRIQGNWFSGGLFYNGRDAANEVWTALGDAAAPATGLEARSKSTAVAHTYRLKLDSLKLGWTFGIANLGAGLNERVGGTAAAVGGIGGISFPLAFSLGNPAVPMQVSTGTPAAALCGATTVGAFYIERIPSKLGCKTYHCRKDGAAIGWSCGR